MKDFFGEDLLLNTPSAVQIHHAIKDLPIIDYHCHLAPNKIQEDEHFFDIGELWLSTDHYKWRAMRLCGVDEYYITGKASYKEKFIKYAEILPQMAGNALYYWTHMELKTIFHIYEPLCDENAERIYNQANKILQDISVLSLLKQFNVEYIATTDSPCDELEMHGTYEKTLVSPTFRPDKLLAFDSAEMQRLSTLTGNSLSTLQDFFAAIEERLVYFIAKGCKIADHSFACFPKRYADAKTAERLYNDRERLTNEERQSLFGFLLVELAKLYHRYGVIMQLHFGTLRNVNGSMFEKCGVDSGFDVIGKSSDIESIIAFFEQIENERRPQTILYSLNDTNLQSLVCATGAFERVHIGPAWWFNDTVLGIKRNLQTIAEYSVLGKNYGMLTDSRSFSSYVRFDFFRRILADYLGDLVEKGEFDKTAAIRIAKNISYYNIKRALRV